MSYPLGKASICHDFPVVREEAAGLIILSCQKIPEMFAAVTSEDQVRPAIEMCLKNALRQDGDTIEVLMEACLDAPVIPTIVRVFS